jgi:CheY-like chemotaxis protein
MSTAPNHKLAAQPVTILLVDDDPDCRQLIKDAMEAGKFDNTVYEVSSGEEALEFLQRKGRYADAPRPGLIYMDIEMPGMGGQETLKAVRTDPRFGDIAIVMMTGVTDDQQKSTALKNGANSYTNKPTDAVTFIHTVLQSTNYWLRIHQFPGGHAVENAA